jgi:drug/metabolite transporter (DMT)-like permease
VTVLLALSGAAAYGLGDFVGGLTSRRTSAWAVALCAQVAGAVLALVLALATGSRLSGADGWWALLAGVGNGLGTAFLYRGLSSGRMGVVAPVSGVGAAVIPVAFGVLSGERPAVLVWVGILAAVPAIWLVSREPAAGAPSSGGFLDGVLAGTGFGVLFVALSRISSDGSALALSLNQAVAGLVIVLVATLTRSAWLPRGRRPLLGGISGVLGTAATGLFILASHGGGLTVTAVVISLYPAFTVLLAALVLRERVHRTQGLGLALCALCVALVAAG